MRTSLIFSAAFAVFGLVQDGFAIPTSSSHSVLAKRGVKECDSDSDYAGPYQDGQGVYIESDQISHPYKFPRVRKCWHDYFAVEASVWKKPWIKSSGNIYCTGTQLCSAAQLNGTQVCQTRSQTVSASMGLKIDAAVSKGVVPGLSFGVEFSSTIENSECYSASSTTTCTWNDKGCHTVWTQQQMVLTKGYERKRCNWGNGDETECMRSWEQNTPTTYTDYGCGSKCEDTNYCQNTDGKPCN
ncbi:hypothetical protein AJ78_03495 [Emergomyces pasteurianus Ep9510]|uniref:Uncharacterized protein n=1 Tax=Emergomyces pasteurianus Ep9510 TaxID=1447872 RepID=A0A1J9PJV3_9EURO|nr:hypothetical protein AJ78_03495 [Emergomyces pasteurianus Ep9510]